MVVALVALYLVKVEGFGDSPAPGFFMNSTDTRAAPGKSMNPFVRNV
jgi:hypothetical protein